MNDATLEGFRQIAATMQGPEPADWQWIGPHLSQRMFGITEARAKQYAARHGGQAQQMQTIATNERRCLCGRVTAFFYETKHGALCLSCHSKHLRTIGVIE